MASVIDNQYQPDVVSPPGETLLETIHEIGMAQTELAARTGRPIKTINEIISGKAAITHDTALQLEMVLGVPASFWTNREMLYRESLARRQEREHLSQHIQWLNTLPVSAMCDRSWICQCSDKAQQMQEILRFFAVASPTAWQKIWSGPISVLRKTSLSDDDLGSEIAWLRRGEIEAQSLQCSPYNKRTFMSHLSRLSLRTHLPFLAIKTELVQACASIGVALVLVDGLPGVKATGATRWLNSKKVMVQLNASDAVNEYHWHLFFHACGHILKHGKRGIFIEPGNSSEMQEHEANLVAEAYLMLTTQASIKQPYHPQASHIPV